MARGQSIFNFGDYHFASWARRGIGNEIPQNDNTLVRAKVPLSIQLNQEVLPQNIDLVGPADIANIARSAIVRTEPLDRDVHVEWNFLPYVEFYDEDFAWRYTPDAPDAKGNLRPWLALVVLKETEFSDLPSRRGALSAIRLQADALPPSADAHLWAHMHTGQHAGVTDLDKILVQIADNFPKDPDGFTCRLLSPRRLDKLTMYHAFLVPAFESGRLAGLGEDFSKIPARQAAWTDVNRPTSMDFPVYFRYSFATTDVSFEDLLSKMKTTSANTQVGTRDMDTSQPGYIKADGSAPVSPTTLVPQTIPPSVMGMEGALRTPNTKSTPYTVNGVFDGFQKDVSALLDKYDNNSSATTTPYGMATMNGDPVLTIPLYGHPYANPRATPFVPSPTPIQRDGKNWYTNINLDPRNRVAAGLGTQVVQQGQEALMQSAWIQLEHLQGARNNIVAVGTIMRRLTDRLVNENLVPAEDFVSMARNSLSRIKMQNTAALTTASTTVLQQMTFTSTPNALINSATRRLTSNNGKLANRLSSASTATSFTANTTVLKQINTTFTTSNLQILRFPFIKIGVPSAIFVPPTLTPTQEAFYAAYNNLMARIPPAPTSMPSVLNFNFIQARQLIYSAAAVSAMQFYKAQISLPKSQAAAISKPPAEVVGQPVFYESLYKRLLALDKEWLLPNLNLIENNTITLLETNAAFINAYMLGANQELAHEMLWREYPADLSTTFFRNFWDAADGNTPPQYFDIEPIEKWLNLPTPPRQSSGSSSKLVLTLRGDLLKKFPNTVIFMMRLTRNNQGELQFNQQGGAGGGGGTGSGSGGGNTPRFEFPNFKAELPPDLQFIGFNVTTSEVNNSNADKSEWFFVLMEPVGEARFGLDADYRPNSGTTGYSRNDLAWTHLKNPDLPNFITASNKPNMGAIQMPLAEKNLWGSDAAAMAALLFQQPFAVIIKASDLLNK